jgi:AraC-like DNA-binding protein
VEQLAADLCMERTGLYRKLTALTQQSPVSFIRNIRLKHAADMILTGDRSITEIAEQTGFGSTSYFSKCFQKEYGCKPSDYKG